MPFRAQAAPQRRCPTCEVGLDPETVADTRVWTCVRCGGAMVEAAALLRLVDPLDLGPAAQARFPEGNPDRKAPVSVSEPPDNGGTGTFRGRGPVSVSEPPDNGGTGTFRGRGPVRYRPCPACAQLMNRHLLEVAAVVVELCKAHGIWFERDELAAVIGAGLRAVGQDAFAIESPQLRELRRWMAVVWPHVGRPFGGGLG